MRTLINLYYPLVFIKSSPFPSPFPMMNEYCVALITFAGKLKSFYFHSCSVCIIGKLFILSLARISLPRELYYYWRWMSPAKPGERILQDRRQNFSTQRRTFVTVVYLQFEQVMQPHICIKHLSDIFVAHTWYAGEMAEKVKGKGRGVGGRNTYVNYAT